MLLGALKTQDVNLAATFLLFVATLTVVGMLVSDLALAAQALGLEDRLDPLEARRQIAIDDDVIVLGPMAHLVGRLRHAAGDLLLAVLRTGAQATLELAGGGRQDEDADQILRRPFGKLLGSLPIDVEQDILAIGQCGLDRCPRRAVVVVENAGMLEEFAPIDHAAKRCRVEELVVDAVLLAGPLGARGA